MRWLSFCFALLLCTGARAERYVIGVESLHYLPYYNYENDQYGGMARDLFDAFAASSGHEFVYRALPIKRLYVEFLVGGLDFKFPDHPTWLSADKAGKTIHYSQAVMPFIDGVLVLPQRKGAGVLQLKVLGTVQGFTAFDYLDEIAAGRIRLHEISALDALIQASLHQRIDGSYFNVVVAERYLSKQMKLPGALVFDPQLPHTQSHYHLSSLKHPALIAAFDQFLHNNPELLRQLRQKWEIPSPSDDTEVIAHP